MAAKKKESSSKKIIRKKVSRPGRHSKKRTSRSKSSKNYKKLNIGQGK
jgi:hypothetical protein